jgi:hypothetical protein
MGIFCIFFLGTDFVLNGKTTCSVWPVVAILFFGVGFTLLNKFGRE